MTTTTGTRPTSITTHRLPRPALVAAALAALMSAFGAYGAIYFTALEGWNDFGITYVTTYEYVSVTGFAASLALFRSGRLGWVGVLWYAAFQVVFAAMKLLTIQEVSAIPFGVVGLVLLVLLTRPSVRGHVAGR